MKPLHLFLVVSTTMAPQLGLLTGCAGNGSTTGAASTSTTTGGTGGSGGGGGSGVAYPPCQDNQAIFTGELDGQPFDTTIPTTGYSLDQGNDPPYVTHYFLDGGEMHLIWQGLAEPEKPKATTGHLIFPGETTPREVLVGSTVIVEIDRRFRVDLLLNQGHLIGCIRRLN